MFKAGKIFDIENAGRLTTQCVDQKSYVATCVCVFDMIR